MKKFHRRGRRIIVLFLITAMVLTFTPVDYGVVYAETVPNYDAEKAVNYAKEHYDDGGTVLDPGREDCIQFVRECLEAGGIPKDENRVSYGDRIPYGYNVDDYAIYMVSNGYAEMYELKTEKQNWSNPQWYVRAEDNKDILSVGDGIIYHCTECKKSFHASIHTGVNNRGFALYYAQNSAVKGAPICLIKCSECGAGKEKGKVYSLHITSTENNYITDYNDITVLGLQVRRIANDKLALKWDEVSGAVGYNLFVKSGKNQAFSLVADTKDTTYTHTEKNSGANYYFAVRPYFEKDGKRYVGKLSTDVLNNEYLLPPTDLKMKVESTGKVLLEWGKVPGAHTYEVYRATGENGVYSKVFELEGVKYRSEMLYPNSIYYYKIKAINKNNPEGNSDFSESITVRTGNIPAPQVKTEIMDNGIRIFWDYVAHANSYKVTRAKELDGKYWDLGTITGNAMKNTSVVPGQVYYYKVEAFNTNKPGSSAVSEVVKQIAKLSPASVQVSNTTGGTPVVSWNIVKGADYYEVYRAESKGGTYSKVQTTSSINYTDISAVKGESYYYKVKAVSNLDSAASSESGIVSFTYKFAERLSGDNRYETAMAVADSIKRIQGVDDFDNIIIACGENYADALAGSYLAKVKNSPILVVNEYTETAVKDYIDNNVKNRGNVYILGGEGAVSKRFEDSLKDYNVKRLGGANRAETNIKILKESGVKDEDILVCSVNSFADSLSASAVGKPILMVDTVLSDTQKAYIGGLLSNNYYLIGGIGEVSDTIKGELEQYGAVTRIAGSDRYTTSKAVADEFFPNGSNDVIIASGDNFPDGLAGGPLAIVKSAPLLLVNINNINTAKGYIDNNKVGKITVIGGQGVVPDNIVNDIIGY